MTKGINVNPNNHYLCTINYVLHGV